MEIEKKIWNIMKNKENTYVLSPPSSPSPDLQIKKEGGEKTVGEFYNLEKELECVKRERNSLHGKITNLNLENFILRNTAEDLNKTCRSLTIEKNEMGKRLGEKDREIEILRERIREKNSAINDLEL